MFRTEHPKVWEMHTRGIPHEVIDAKLHLEPGTAHDQIVAAWKADNDEWTERLRERKRNAYR